jgi:hypothetical protein
MKEPYNTLAKDKVTLPFVGLLWQAKTAGSKGSGTAGFWRNPLKMRLTRFSFGLRIAS